MNSTADLKNRQEAICNQILAVVKAINCKFTFNNQPISIEKAFSPLGLLSAIVRRADQLCSFCMGYGLGVTFEKADNAMLGVSVVFDQKIDISIRLLCITDVLLEIVHNSSSKQAIPLDTLVED